MIAALLLVAAVALSPVEEKLTDRVDVVEINHLYDFDGEVVLRQLIFWEWRPHERSFRVVAWRNLHHGMWPQRDHGNDVVCRWLEKGRVREVRAGSMRETWTQYDPEVFDRRFLSQHQRRGLTGDSSTCRSTSR